ncbi:MAG TPA: hypothetical protein VF178_05245 [Gemmatimonadaceae bacterium]
MLTSPDIQALVRDLSGTKVLSVYLETRFTDPAMRDAWRASLATTLRNVAASVPEQERPEFERAKAALDKILPELGTTPGAEGWVAFVTATGEVHTGDLPTRCPTFAAWRDGPVVAPYLRVLKEYRPVIVALVDSRAARLYRYAWGILEELPDMAVSAEEHPAPGHEPQRTGQAVPGARSATGTERVQRRQDAAFVRLASALADRLAEVAGEDAWIVIGGMWDKARHAAEALPKALAHRAIVSETLGNGAASRDIIEAAKHAATTLRAAHGQALLDVLFERAGAPRPAVRGIPAVQRALLADAVDLLLLSPTFVYGDTKEAESIVRSALVQGAQIEVLSGDAAARLDKEASGVGARLRFAVE